MKGETFEDVALRMDDRDDVATALADLSAGRNLDVGENTVTLAEDVPFGHKLALRPLGAGDEIVKYGEVIGVASADIDAGEWVHTHNCESMRGRGDKAATEGSA
ncbi:UxaA family hydrolase [Haloplanus pelagicus]|jgi:altronate dehydratase small subunit|uniref:UxaA family hydrolase n=1 Tax=Haloplanus pelagicus TaxID=2949995 RepID=UPI00203F513B|nr:UxaA family hydrolase [Haloplanus sp. HW8-1]